MPTSLINPRDDDAYGKVESVGPCETIEASILQKSELKQSLEYILRRGDIDINSKEV